MASGPNPQPLPFREGVSHEEPESSSRAQPSHKHARISSPTFFRGRGRLERLSLLDLRQVLQPGEGAASATTLLHRMRHLAEDAQQWLAREIGGVRSTLTVASRGLRAGGPNPQPLPFREGVSDEEPESSSRAQLSHEHARTSSPTFFRGRGRLERLSLFALRQVLQPGEGAASATTSLSRVRHLAEEAQQWLAREIGGIRSTLTVASRGLRAASQTSRRATSPAQKRGRGKFCAVILVC
jgi:hypothetical protein